MRKHIAIILAISFISAVAYGFTKNLAYYTNNAMTTKTTSTYSATDTVYTKPGHPFRSITHQQDFPGLP